jgi:hypothetical protein
MRFMMLMIPGGYEKAAPGTMPDPAAVERVVKGFLFDCQMCGQCALSSTGMSDPGHGQGDSPMPAITA